MLKNKMVLFGAITLLIIAFALRAYRVDSAPSGVFIDEASFGNNAYSILRTGRDEHGVKYPLVFKAFGDQKLPAYAYALVPFVRLFGLNNLAVRMPSVLAGTALSCVLFLLFIEFGFTLPVSFIGGLIAATSPWSLILSRFGFESNFGLLFFILGIFLTLKAYKKDKNIFAVFAGLCFGITLYSYVAFKLITPVILISIFAIYRYVKKTKSNIWLIIFSSFVISILPILITVFSAQTTARFTQVGTTYNSGLKMEIDENRAFCGEHLPKILCYMSSNKPLFYLRTYVHRYISALSPGYLFLDGDVEYAYLNVDHFGSFYVWLLPFYFFGFAYIWNKIKKNSLSPFDYIVIVGLIIAPLPTLLVSGPQKVRISAFFPFICILIVYGISQIEGMIKKFSWKYIYYAILTVLCLISAIYFMIHFLTIQINKDEISYGTVPKLMKYLGQQDKETQIYIRSITEGITYYVYSNAVDPSLFQKKVVFGPSDAIGFSHATDLENIHITGEDAFGIACRAKKQGVHALFVSNENNPSVPDSAKKIIYSENGVDSLAVVYDLGKIDYDYGNCPKKDVNQQ